VTYLSKGVWIATQYKRLLVARLHAQFWRLRGAKLGAKSMIGPRCRLDRPWCLSTGIRTVFEHDVYLKSVDDAARLAFGDFCFIGSGVEVDVLLEVTIGNHCLLAPGCFIVDHTHGMVLPARIDQQPCQAAPIRIGSDVWIGAHAIILPGVTIGDGAVVGANAVVRETVASGAIVAGVPARTIGHRSCPKPELTP